MSDKILEAVDGIGKKIDEQKTSFDKTILEQKAHTDTKFAEAQKLATEANAKLEAEVKTLNEDLSKKGATLEEIQKQVKDLRAGRGRFSGGEDAMEKKTAELIADAFKEHFDEIKSTRKGAPAKLEMKAVGTMTAANNLAGNTVATYNLTPAIRGRRKINIRDLVPVINSSTGTWKFYRQSTPVGEGSVDFQTTHGAVKNQMDYDLAEVTVTADYLAAFVRIAKQMLQDLPFLQNFVAGELVEDYKRTESQKFFDILTAGATGSTNANGKTVLAEKYIVWMANLMANDYYPSAIVTTALNWAEILLTKPNDYNVPGGIQIAADGTILFCGIPLIPQNNIATGKTLIGDFSKAAIIQAESLAVEFFEQDADNVQRNLITARIEARVALANLRPDAFIYA